VFFRYGAISTDACDGHDFDFPFFGDNPKDWSSIDHRLKNKFGGILWHGDAETTEMSFYACDQRTIKGGNFWCTAFLQEILRRDKEPGKGPLPKVLYIHSDNGSEFKNQTWLRMWEWLVKHGVFEKVKICFYPVGHSHCIVDACFGRLSMVFNSSGQLIRTLEECVREAKRVIKRLTGIWFLTVSLLSKTVLGCACESRILISPILFPLTGHPRPRQVLRRPRAPRHRRRRHQAHPGLHLPVPGPSR
jgi:hypothetical protein